MPAIDSYPLMSSPLSGAETFIGTQGGLTMIATADMIAARSSGAAIISPSGDTTGVADTAAFQAAAAAGGAYVLIPGATYYLETCVHFTIAATTFVCVGGVATIVMLTGTGQFDLATYNSIGYENSGYGANPNPHHACFYFYNAANVQLVGVTFQMQASALRRCCIPVVFDGCASFILAKCAATGFDLPYRGLFSARNGCTNAIIDQVSGTDCGPTTDFGSSSPTDAQATVLELDGQNSTGVQCSGFNITRLSAVRVKFTGSALTRWGDQSDCYNDQAQSKWTGHNVFGVYAEEVGEPVDIFSNGNTISNVRAIDIYSWTIKIGHGASYNTIRGITTERTAREAVVIYGDTTYQTSDNRVEGVVAKDVGYYAASHASGVIPAGFLIDCSSAGYQPVVNNHISGYASGYSLTGTPQMREVYIMNASANAGATGNSFSGYGDTYIDGVNPYFAEVVFNAADTTQSCWPKIIRDKKTNFSRYVATAVSLNDSQTIPYDTAIYADDGFWDNVNFDWVCTTYTQANVVARLRLPGLADDRLVTVVIYKNSNIVGSDIFLNKSGLNPDVVLCAEASVRVEPGDIIRAALLCTVASTGAASSASISNSSEFSTLDLTTEG